MDKEQAEAYIASLKREREYVAGLSDERQKTRLADIDAELERMQPKPKVRKAVADHKDVQKRG